MPTWENAKALLGLGEESPVTDASEADNYLVEAAIIAFQEAAKTLTDLLAETSSGREDQLRILTLYREAVSEAYVALADGKIEQAYETLRKVVNK